MNAWRPSINIVGITETAPTLEQPYLLGLLAMIKCSICSYQCDNWYVSNWRLACHINFCLGRCPLELAQRPLRVALAWHFARRSTPFGVTIHWFINRNIKTKSVVMIQAMIHDFSRGISWWSVVSGIISLANDMKRHYIITTLSWYTLCVMTLCIASAIERVLTQLTSKDFQAGSTRDALKYSSITAFTS